VARPSALDTAAFDCMGFFHRWLPDRSGKEGGRKVSNEPGREFIRWPVHALSKVHPASLTSPSASRSTDSTVQKLP
jgi:hypothetical protein